MSIADWINQERQREWDDLHPEHVCSTPEEWWQCHNSKNRRGQLAKQYIYFLRDGKLVKIGEADDVEKRLAQLSTANLRLELIGSVSANGIRDTEVHFWLNEWRIHPDREFFQLDQPVKEWIEECLRIGGLAIPPNWKKTHAKTTLCGM